MASMYTCDVCSTATFAKLEDAEAHEAQCHGPPSSKRKLSLQDGEDTSAHKNNERKAYTDSAKEKFCWMVETNAQAGTNPAQSGVANPDARSCEVQYKDVSLKRKLGLCLVEGCTTAALKNDRCFKHGAKKPICSHRGCASYVKKQGLCGRHGEKTPRKKCSTAGCTSIAISRGRCCKHGAKPKCTVHGCNNLVQNSNLCRKHGAFLKNCSVIGCSNLSRRKGLCVKHGGKPAIKLCYHCSNRVHSRNLCKTHLSEIDPKLFCSVKGCTTQSVNGGRCIKHGAQEKRCKVDGCDNKVQRKGKCWRHGGAPSKCKCSGCISYAYKGGYCVKHKSLIQYCSSDACSKFANKYGLCRNHFQEAAAALSLRNSKENGLDIGKSSKSNDNPAKPRSDANCSTNNLSAPPTARTKKKAKTPKVKKSILANSRKHKRSKIAGSLVSMLEIAPSLPKRKIQSLGTLFKKRTKSYEAKVIPHDLKSNYSDALQSFVHTPFDERTMKALHQFRETKQTNTMKWSYAEKFPILTQREYLRRNRGRLIDEMERDLLEQIESSMEGVASDCD